MSKSSLLAPLVGAAVRVGKAMLLLGPDSCQTWVRLGKADMGVNQVMELCLGIIAMRGHQHQQAVDGAVKHRRDDFVLTLEVAVDRGTTEAGRLADIVHPDPIEASLEEQEFSRINDAFVTGSPP